MRGNGNQQTKELIAKWAVASRLAGQLQERHDEAHEHAKAVGTMLDEAIERAAEIEDEAVATLQRWGGRLIVENVLLSVVQCEDGISRLKAEPMGTFGVKRPKGGAA